MQTSKAMIQLLITAHKNSVNVDKKVLTQCPVTNFFCQSFAKLDYEMPVETKKCFSL